MIVSNHEVHKHCEEFETILRDWLSEKDLVLICGQWGEGAVSEILTHGEATLSPSAYEGKFVGLRDLRLKGEKHHLHLDLAKFEYVEYVVWPSVCFGWKPSFEVHFASQEGPGNFAVSLGQPYQGQKLNQDKARTFFRRFLNHRERFGSRVRCSAKSSRAPADRVADVWREVAECALEFAPDATRSAFSFAPNEPLLSVQSLMKTLSHPKVNFENHAEDNHVRGNRS